MPDGKNIRLFVHNIKCCDRSASPWNEPMCILLWMFSLYWEERIIHPLVCERDDICLFASISFERLYTAHARKRNIRLSKTWFTHCLLTSFIFYFFVFFCNVTHHCLLKEMKIVPCLFWAAVRRLVWSLNDGNGSNDRVGHCGHW